MGFTEGVLLGKERGGARSGEDVKMYFQEKSSFRLNPRGISKAGMNCTTACVLPWSKEGGHLYPPSDDRWPKNVGHNLAGISSWEASSWLRATFQRQEPMWAAMPQDEFTSLAKGIWVDNQKRMLQWWCMRHHSSLEQPRWSTNQKSRGEENEHEA